MNDNQTPASDLSAQMAQPAWTLEEALGVSTSTKLIKDATRSAIEGWGWRWTNMGEASVIRALHEIGIRPDEVEQQFHLGQYRIDFAFPRERMALEADGWVHGTRQARADRARDRQIGEWGWETIRVDTDGPYTDVFKAVSAFVSRWRATQEFYAKQPRRL